MKRAVLLVLAAGAAACAKIDTGSDTEFNAGGAGLIATGSLPLSAGNFAAVGGSTSCVLDGASSGIAYAAVLASNLSAICADLQQDRSRADARSVELVVARLDPGSPGGAVGTGIYPVVIAPGPDAAFALLRVSQADAHCSRGEVIATAGSVEVTSVAGGGIRGTVDAQLSDGGTIRGAFDAPACAATLGDVCSGRVGPATSTCAP